MADSGWSDSGQPVLKILAAALAIALIGAVGAALYWNGSYNSMRSTAGYYQKDYQDEAVTANYQSQTISSLENNERPQVVPQLLLNSLTITLTNSSTLVLSYNATATGYITMNGTASSKSWVVACYGASTLAGCQSSQAAGTNYALMAYWSGMKVPVLPGPMVVLMSSDSNGQVVLTCVAYV